MPVTSRKTPTGALELIQQEFVHDLFDLNASDSGKSSSIDARHGSFSLVVMNPPYSRTRKDQSLFDIANLNDKQRMAAQKRTSHLAKNTPANLKAGLASHFAHLAHVKLGPSGRLAMVLPLTATMAESWRDTRARWEKHYTDILCITHAGGSSGETAMSEDTGMGEMLLLARKGRKNGAPQEITSVTLRTGIPHALAGRCVAQAIHSSLACHANDDNDGSIILADKPIGSFSRQPADGNGDPWLGVGLLDPSLASSMIQITTRRTLWTPTCRVPIPIRVPIVPLNSIFNTGPTHHLIGYPRGGTPIGGFCLDKIAPNSPYPTNPSLWMADSTTQKKLVVEPTHEGTEIDKQMATKMRQKTSCFFISRNLRYTSQALAAAFIPDSAMGGRAWNAIQEVPENTGKICTLWFNSTLGILLRFKEAQRQQQGRGTMQTKQVGSLLIIDFRTLPAKRLNRAKKDFDLIAQKDMLPVACLNKDPVREEIDEAIIRLLDLPTTASGAFKDLRKRLSREPTITGKTP